MSITIISYKRTIGELTVVAHLVAHQTITPDSAANNFTFFFVTVELYKSYEIRVKR